MRATNRELVRLSLVLVLGAAPLSASCDSNVKGGTRLIEDCLCDCEFGCDGTEQNPTGPAGPSSTQAATSGPGGTGGFGPGTATTGAGGEGGGAGGGETGCEPGANRLAVLIDGLEREACDAEVLHAAGTATISALFAEGETVAIELEDDASVWSCAGITLVVAAGAETAQWSTDTCEADVVVEGQRVRGSFSATVEPDALPAVGERVLAGGVFDVPGP